MADFIYLLQNRLTPAQWRALETVREAARTQGMPVFLVGGAVRDLSTGSPVRDLDFALQGDINALVPDLEASGATITGRNEVVPTLYLTFRGGVRAELGSSLTVTYPKPGQPEAHPAPILDDLRRRDFTANAMAVSLNEGSYGLLLDPLNGTADIENRELRLVSAYGFIEQPALLLRAARLGERLGWSLEERTANRYQTGKDEGYIKAIPAADRGYELEEIFHEEDPLFILEHMESEGWGETLFPGLRSADGDRAGLDHVRDLIGQLEGQGIHPDPSALYFPLVTAKLSDQDKVALKKLFARPGFAEQIDTIETRAKELAGQLTSKAAALPSESWRLLMNAEPDLVLWLAVHTRVGGVQTKIKAFLKDWPQMRQKIPYALMQEMRITPDLPEYEKLLDDLFFALIDGKLDTPEATRAFLEPYSPPAPPQVQVRRRPAKASRGRAKKVVEEAAPEPADESEDADDEDDDSSDEDTDESSDEGSGNGGRKSRDEEDEDEDEDEKQPAPAKAPAKVRSPEKKAAPQVTEVAAEVPAPPPSAAANISKQPDETAPLKSASTKAAPVPVKVATKGVAPAPETNAAEKTTPAKAVPAKAAGNHAVPSKSPVKASVKAAPSKTPAVKGKPAPVTKVVAKKIAAKAVAKKAPAKVPAKKGVPAPAKASKTAPVKAAVKKQAVKGRAPAPAKRALPVKAAKKAAVKGRSGR